MYASYLYASWFSAGAHDGCPSTNYWRGNEDPNLGNGIGSPAKQGPISDIASYSLWPLMPSPTQRLNRSRCPPPPPPPPRTSGAQKRGSPTAVTASPSRGGFALPQLGEQQGAQAHAHRQPRLVPGAVGHWAEARAQGAHRRWTEALDRGEGRRRPGS